MDKVGSEIDLLLALQTSFNASVETAIIKRFLLTVPSVFFLCSSVKCEDVVQYADLIYGTGDFNNNTFHGVVAPSGTVQWSPDTEAGLHKRGYSYSDSVPWIPTTGAWLGAACAKGSAQAFTDLETQIGRQLDVLRLYHTQGSWTQLTSHELSYVESGQKLLLSVKLASLWINAVGAANGGSATVDSEMASLACSIASVKPYKVMLIVWHEPENDVVGSVPGASAGTAAQYMEMWHNVRTIFDANGATNVIWRWDVQSYAPLRYLLQSLWPGNGYVDRVMWDWYQSSASKSITSVVQDAYNWFVANSDSAHDYLSKPWGLAEWGLGINKYCPTTTEQINGINVMNTALGDKQFPRLKLLSYFDEGPSALLSGAISAFTGFANSPYMMQTYTVTSVATNPNGPGEFSLNQNYPNPFNPSTAFIYRLSKLSHVTLDVYDVLGREVASLVNGYQAAGDHAVTFDGANIPSGVHFYRLDVGDRTTTKKMVLINSSTRYQERKRSK